MNFTDTTIRTHSRGNGEIYDMSTRRYDSYYRFTPRNPRSCIIPAIEHPGNSLGFVFQVFPLLLIGLTYIY